MFALSAFVPQSLSPFDFCSPQPEFLREFAHRGGVVVLAGVHMAGAGCRPAVGVGVLFRRAALEVNFAAGIEHEDVHGAVEQALVTLLERGEAFDYAAVKALAQPVEPAVPVIHIGVPDLRRYDALLAAGGES